MGLTETTVPGGTPADLSGRTSAEEEAANVGRMVAVAGMCRVGWMWVTGLRCWVDTTVKGREEEKNKLTYLIRFENAQILL